MGDLHGNSRAVAGILLAAAGAPMLEIDQDLNCLLHYGVRFATFEIHDKAHAARIMFESWIVQTLFGRRRAWFDYFAHGIFQIKSGAVALHSRSIEQTKKGHQLVR